MTYVILEEQGDIPITPLAKEGAKHPPHVI